MTLAANVDALKSCSAYNINETSTVLIIKGSTISFYNINLQKFSAILSLFNKSVFILTLL